jgi:hypothetical protein
VHGAAEDAQGMQDALRAQGKFTEVAQPAMRVDLP